MKDFTSLDCIGIALVASVWVLLVILLKNVRTFGQYQKHKPASDVELLQVSHQREMDLMADNIMTLRQLIRARVEIDLLKKRDSA